MKKVTYRDINNNTGEIEVNKLFFRPSVYGILIKENKILLVPQWDGYDLPGGGMEIYETVEEALEREFWEETGLKVKRKEIITCESNFFKLPYGSGDKKYCNSILMYYLCEYVSGEITTDNFDDHEKEYASKAKWIDLDKIETIKFYTSVDAIAIIKKATKLIENK